MEKLLSIILPSYNEGDNIPFSYKTISDELTSHNINYELIYVDDGSKDETYSNIETLAKAHANVHGVSFSRNFGKEAAIFAGLKEANGDCCVVMDCDMQHPVEIVPKMYRLWDEEGYEVIEGVKSDRGRENIIHRGFAKLFYGLISSMSGINMNDTSDFKLLDRKAVDSLLEMPEKAPFFRGLSQWIGYKSIKVPFEVKERSIGTTKWSTTKLVKYALHNITIFSSKPLQIVTSLGAIFIFASIVLMIQTLYRYFTGNSMEGFTTVITLILLSNGILMIALGIIGNYIAQIYDEIKARPRYIISKKV